MDSGKGKEIVIEDYNPEEEHFPSPTIRIQMLLLAKKTPTLTLRGQRGWMSSPSPSSNGWMRLLRELSGQTGSRLSLWLTCLVGMQLHWQDGFGP